MATCCGAKAAVVCIFSTCQISSGKLTAEAMDSYASYQRVNNVIRLPDTPVDNGLGSLWFVISAKKTADHAETLSIL